ncbi:unnamed protein product [Heterobilharzia americana]|nr:unnamed protein product [Heterobilharzia americana]
MGHVRRSPAYYRNFLSLGSKSDFWISVDMNTGKIIESVFQDYVDKCPTSLNSGNMNTLQNSTKQQVDIINLGRTQYNLVLRDRFTGSVKLNITYNTFATHTEADLQNYDLQHVAITQPALLTFEGPKLIWSLPLSSPVIGMYAVWSPSSDSSSSLHNNNMPNAQMHEEAPSYGDPSDDEVVTTTFQDSIITESNENNKKNNVNDNNSNRPSQKEVVQLPRVLRRIAFTTYALDLRNISSFPEDRIYDEIEAKFSGTLDLAPSLYIGRSKSAPVYALLCVAEATLRLRGLRRASEMYMLEGPKNLIVVNNSQQETTTESDSSSGTNRTDDNWPTGLIGLYEMPPSYNRAWDNNEMDDQFMPMRKRGNRLKRLSSLSSDASTMWAIIVPPPSPLASPTETVNTSEITVSQDSAVIDTHKNTNDSSHAEDSHLNHRPLSNSRWLLWSTSLLCTILCIITVWILFLSFFTKSRKTYSTIQHTKYFEVVNTIFSKLFILHHNKNLNFSTSTHTEKTNLSTEMHLTIPGFLPPHFDTPDSSGWAGCSAQEAGQPEPIRINLNEVLGHGANGTMVFAGTYGPHETAVKRIVRHPLLEKHWRREHAILLRHQHPHLVRCYWTGSTANFHYLVMQRCALSLNEALSRSTRAPPPSSSDCTNPTNPTKTSLLDDLGLTPVEIIHQFISAVACLHRNHIVHRDLKPSNILIVMNDNHNSTNTGDNNNSSEKARIVVGDFGLSRPLSTDERQQPHDATLNSFGPHISMKIQQMKSRSSGHTSNNSISSDRYNSVGSAEINDHNTSNDVYGICVRYHNQKEHNPTRLLLIIMTLRILVQMDVLVLVATLTVVNRITVYALPLVHLVGWHQNFVIWNQRNK